MQHYLAYTTEQFVWDDFFRDWVLHPTPATDARWRQWLAENPEKNAVVEQARELVLALRVRERSLPKTELEASVQQIVARALPDDRIIRPNWFWRYRLPAAAALFLLIGLAGWLWVQKHPVSSDPLASQEQSRITNRRNTTDKPLLVNLSDGSLVVLQPRSQVRFPAVFEANKREVYLTGDAFFEVQKDPKRPFFVFADEIVTKVLGTSFSVRAFENEQGISVKVKTGRVAVFHRSNLEKNPETDQTSIVLKAHQQVEYSRKKAQMTKRPLTVPSQAETDPVFYRFEFDDTPLPTVVQTLENAYGVHIQYDREQVKDCPLTARFADQSLHEMLEFICKALNGSYSMQDGQLMLDVKGCNE